MIDGDQNHQKPDAEPETPANQLLLDRQQRLGFRAIDFIPEVGLRHAVSFWIDHDPNRFDHDLISLFVHDLRANAPRLSRGKTGSHFSGSCSSWRAAV